MIKIVSARLNSHERLSLRRRPLKKKSASATSVYRSAVCRCSLHGSLVFFPRTAFKWKICCLPFSFRRSLLAGELDYIAGVGPGTVSATLAGSPVARGVDRRQSTDLQSVIAQPELKTLQDLRGKRIGVSGLGATTHTCAQHRVSKDPAANPKEFVVCRSRTAAASARAGVESSRRGHRRPAVAVRAAAKRASTECSTWARRWKCRWAA